MPTSLANTLHETISREAPLLKALAEQHAAVTPNGGASWSPKQELGHLIDSAVNNHVRFVRASLEPKVEAPGYQQDGWVDLHGYQEWPWPRVIACWESQNAQLVELIQRIPAARLETPCSIGGSAPVTLRFLIEDYTLHMRHHIDHLLKREKITQYPGAALGV